MTTIDKLSDLARNSGVIVGATTLALGAGFLTGYYFAKTRLESEINEKAEQRITEQVDAARQYVQISTRDKEYATPEEAIEALLPEATEALRSYALTDAKPILESINKRTSTEAYLSADAEATADMVDTTTNDAALIVQRTRYDNILRPQSTIIPPERRNNVWQDDAEIHQEQVDFDYSAEEAARTTDAPYIISQEEYLENAPEYRQTPLTYFAKDGVLLDDEDDIVTEPGEWIGEGLLRFGHRSNDNRIVYIRNPIHDHDFQIALSDGSYAEEVAGFNEEDLRG